MLLHHLININNRIDTCATYFTNSDTTKNAGIGPIPILGFCDDTMKQSLIISY